MSTAEDKTDKSSNESAGASTSRGTKPASTSRSAKPKIERVPIAQAMSLASRQLAELLQCEPGSVSAVKPTSKGWTASVEVVEVERIPETTSVMGSYRVQLDSQGNLLGYERTSRYTRGQIDQRK